jgi:hypothetical protein
MTVTVSILDDNVPNLLLAFGIESNATTAATNQTLLQQKISTYLQQQLQAYSQQLAMKSALSAIKPITL